MKNPKMTANLIFKKEKTESSINLSPKEDLA